MGVITHLSKELHGISRVSPSLKMCGVKKRGVAFYNQQIPPSGGLSTLTTSVPVTGGNVAQIPATKQLDARAKKIKVNSSCEMQCSCIHGAPTLNLSNAL